MTKTEQLQLNLGFRNPELDAGKVIRLRFKLGKKAKQEPEFRFYSTFNEEEPKALPPFQRGQYVQTIV